MAHNSTNSALFYVTSCYLALEDHKLHALARHVRARALAQEISIALDPRFARSTLAGGGRREAGGGRREAGGGPTHLIVRLLRSLIE